MTVFRAVAAKAKWLLRMDAGVSDSSGAGFVGILPRLPREPVPSGAKRSECSRSLRDRRAEPRGLEAMSQADRKFASANRHGRVCLRSKQGKQPQVARGLSVYCQGCYGNPCRRARSVASAARGLRDRQTGPQADRKFASANRHGRVCLRSKQGKRLKWRGAWGLPQ